MKTTGPKQGEWKFDPTYWKDPGESAMRRLLSTWNETSASTPAPSDFVIAPPSMTSLKLDLQQDSAPTLPTPLHAKHPVIKIEEFA